MLLRVRLLLPIILLVVMLNVSIPWVDAPPATSESQRTFGFERGGRWDLQRLSEWRNRVEANETSIELIIGLVEDQTNSQEGVMNLISEAAASLVDIISIGGQVKAIAINIPIKRLSSFISKLQASNLVSYAEPNLKFQASFLPNDPSWGLQWGLKKIRADYAWNTTRGNHSILVAVIDTGMDWNHPDLAPNYVAGGKDWVNNDLDPMDDNGHGTHIAGIIAAVVNNSIGTTGLAQVRIMAEKGLDSSGVGDANNLANAITHAVDQNADIINLSWGSYDPSNLIEDAVEYANSRGVIVVAAAGNDATSRRYYPAAYDETIAVTATDQNDFLASFSNYGDWVELAAPGVNIYSTLRDDDYGNKSGTSLAAPHITGVAALIWSRFPTMNASQVRRQLRYSADDLGLAGFDVNYGYGRVNAEKAVEKILAGGRTLVGSKPVYPIRIMDGQIPVDGMWNITYTLRKGNSYHAYLYGGWVNSTTNYDVSVHDPDGRSVANLTKAAGLPEQLDMADKPFFKPEKSGNYTLMIRNFSPERGMERNATLLLIEHLDTDQWYVNKLYMEGKDALNNPRFNTTWAYEFNTTSQRIEVWVRAPETLDMYEVRLYLVANPVIGRGYYLPPYNVPLAWEPALYGKNITISGRPFGGYNLDFKGLKGNVFDGDVSVGQDMLINYTSPYAGNLLYHLVFVAEQGYGNLSFIVKTDFTPPTIYSVTHSPPQPEFDETVSVTANATENSELFLNWLNGTSWGSTRMGFEEGLYVATIPALPFNTTVQTYANASYEGFPDLTGRAIAYSRKWTRSSAYSYTVTTHVTIDQVHVSDTRADLDTSQTVQFHAILAHDGSSFAEGSIYVNGTAYSTNETGWITIRASSSKVRKMVWTITGISYHGITKYRKAVADPYIVWDRVKVTPSVDDERIDMGANATLRWNAVYEYDKTTFGGVVILNNTQTRYTTVGRRGYSVASIIDTNYQLTSLTTNTVYVIWDRVNTIDGGVSSDSVDVGQTATVWFRAVYEYDGEAFNSSKGTLYVDDSPMSWSDANNRWERDYAFGEAGRRKFAVMKVLDSRYGLTVVSNSAEPQNITWKSPIWTEWWFWLVVGTVTILVVLALKSIYVHLLAGLKQKL